LEPLPGLVDLGLQAVGCLLQGIGLCRRYDLPKRRAALCKNFLWQAERREQPARGPVANAWRQ
jgi:hypothetical protein